MNNQSPPSQLKPSIEALKISKRIQKLMSDQKLNCSQSHPAVKVCLNKTCLQVNAFICADDKKQCPCIKLHENCQEKSLQSFMTMFSKQEKLIKIIEQMIMTHSDLFIDSISLLREKISSKLSSLDWLWKEQISYSISEKKNDSKDKSQTKPQKFSNLNEINSYAFNEIWTCNQQGLRTLMSGKIKQKIKQFSQFMMDHIEAYFAQVQNYLCFLRQKIVMNTKQQFKQEFKLGKVQWDPFTFDKNCKIQNLRFTKEKPLVTYANNNPNPTIGILKPSLNQMKGSIISWRIQIKNASRLVSLGICDKQIFKSNPKQVLSHGIYMISSNKKVLFHNNKIINGTLSSFEFAANDIISIKFNKPYSTLTFQKQNTIQSYVIKVNEKDFKNKPNFYIGIQLSAPGDSIQILGPLLAQTGVYTYQAF